MAKSKVNKPKDMTKTVIELSMLDRLSLVWVLPREWSILTMMTSKRITDKIAFSADEMDEREIKDTAQWVTGKKWRHEVTGKYEFSDGEIKVIQAELKKLSEENKLGMHLVNIREKFIWE